MLIYHAQRNANIVRAEIGDGDERGGDGGGAWCFRRGLH